MLLDTLANRPMVGATTSMGSSIISYLEILNPILSFVSLCIGVLVGMVTLYLQVKRLKNWRME